MDKNSSGAPRANSHPHHDVHLPPVPPPSSYIQSAGSPIEYEAIIGNPATRRTYLLNKIPARGQDTTVPTFELFQNAQISSAIYGSAYRASARQASGAVNDGAYFIWQIENIIDAARDGVPPGNLERMLVEARNTLAKHFTDQANLHMELARITKDVPEAHHFLDALPNTVVPEHHRDFIQEVGAEVLRTNQDTIHHVEDISRLGARMVTPQPAPYQAPCATQPGAVPSDYLIQQAFTAAAARYDEVAARPVGSNGQSLVDNYPSQGSRRK